jgi:predicted aldo/keto reductase-like oxidoreductase
MAKFTFNNKPFGLLSVGCMRFDGREQAAELIPYCAQHGAVFLDTSPMYSYRSEKENNETWVGGAIKGIRDKVILSAKCSPGNGGDGIGEYNKTHGFSVTTADKVRAVIEQSLKRLEVDSFDVYQLWTVSNELVYKEAFKKGGWLEGVMKAKDEGLFKHLGITTHAGNDFIKMAVDEGIFETITAPFHIMDNSRLEGLQYAISKNIAPIAMNPLAGGTLANADRQTAAKLSDAAITSSVDLAIRYVNAFGISALAGMSNLEQAKLNIEVMQKPALTAEQASSLRERFLQMVDAEQFKCTSCGYCMPCPQEINIPEIFKLWNQVKVLGLAEASGKLREKDKEHKISSCTKCGECEKKCPNQLDIIKMLDIISNEI